MYHHIQIIPPFEWYNQVNELGNGVIRIPIVLSFLCRASYAVQAEHVPIFLAALPPLSKSLHDGKPR